MNENTKLSFYIITVDGQTVSAYVTYEEAISELSLYISEDDTGRCGIERIDGIWNLLKCLGSFENYNDDWMEYVLENVSSMVKRRKTYLKNTANKTNESPDNN